MHCRIFLRISVGSGIKRASFLFQTAITDYSTFLPSLSLFLRFLILFSDLPSMSQKPNVIVLGLSSPHI